MNDNAKFTTKDFAKDETIFLQGENGDCVYIIISGSVEISRKTETTKDIVTQMSSGDILGEMALLSNEPRCASATAKEPTKVIMVKDRTLRMALLNNDLPILKPLTNQLTLRFKEVDQQASYYRNKVKKLEEEVASLKESLLHYELPAEN